MWVLLAVNIVSIVCAYFAQVKKYEVCLLFSFVFIGLFLAFRYDFGNDYMAYFYMHQEIQSEIGLSSYYEKGWVLLNKIFSNFYILIFFLAIINSYIYFRFINRYVPEKMWWLAVFLYVFNTNFMLVQSSTMRQTVAILIFIYSFKYILRGQLGIYLLCCFLAISFHISAIILLPIYFCRYIKLKSFFSGMYLTLIFIFLYAPIVTLIIFSFNEGKGSRWKGFSLICIYLVSISYP